MIEVRLLQSAKAATPILFTLFGIAIEVRLLQPLKASDSMLFTLLGIIISVNPMQSSKALLPIVVTLLGMNVFLQPIINVFVSVSIIALHSFLESYTLFPSSTLMEDKQTQS